MPGEISHINTPHIKCLCKEGPYEASVQQTWWMMINMMCTSGHVDVCTAPHGVVLASLASYRSPYFPPPPSSMRIYTPFYTT